MLLRSLFLKIIVGIFAGISLLFCLSGCSILSENSSVTKQSSASAVSSQQGWQPQFSQQQVFEDLLGFRDVSGVINRGPKDRKVVALTFDADMTPKMLKDLQSGKIKSWYEKRIVDTLQKKSVPATFFITGMWAQTYPDAVKSFASNPLFEIENHSYDHSSFKTPCYGLQQATDKNMEVTKTQDIIYKLTGQNPKFFRFPGGCYSKSDVKLVQSFGLEVIGWDVVSGDAYLKNSSGIVKEVLAHATNGSIVVMHLNGGPHASATYEALPTIIEKLQAKGFDFVTVSQLFQN